MGKFGNPWPLEALSRRYQDQVAAIIGPRQPAAAAPAPPAHATITAPPPSKRVQRSRTTPAAPKKRKLKARTRNAGTWTEARYWQTLRSGLRRIFRFWKPAIAALHAARVAAPGPHGRKHLYLCADCKKLFPRKQVQIDHVQPVGRLLDFDDLPVFVRLLTPEDPAAFAVRCKSCHQAKTNQERATP